MLSVADTDMAVVTGASGRWFTTEPEDPAVTVARAGDEVVLAVACRGRIAAGPPVTVRLADALPPGRK